jgi:hypothetical protein
MRRCEQCETTIHTRATTGRWRRFCTNACRQKAYRQRALLEQERREAFAFVRELADRLEAGVLQPAPSAGRCPYGTEPLDEALKQQLLQS